MNCKKLKKYSIISFLLAIGGIILVIVGNEKKKEIKNIDINKKKKEEDANILISIGSILLGVNFFFFISFIYKYKKCKKQINSPELDLMYKSRNRNNSQSEFKNKNPEQDRKNNQFPHIVKSRYDVIERENPPYLIIDSKAFDSVDDTSSLSSDEELFLTPRTY